MQYWEDPRGRQQRSTASLEQKKYSLLEKRHWLSKGLALLL